MTRAISGSTVLITGAGSGIGRLTALRLADKGARIIVWDLDGSAAEAVAAEITAAGHRALAMAVDVSDRAAVMDAAADVGAVDVLINNAGVVTGRPLIEASEEQIRRTFDVNVLALYWTTQAFLPGMLERNSGAVMTIASAAALVGVPKQTDYSASKAAAFGFAESLRMELAKSGSAVRSQVVCPYYISTGMFEGVRTKFPRLLPILEPEAVAAAIVAAAASGAPETVLPAFAKSVRAARLLPVAAFDRVVRFFGITDTMDEFRGRGRLLSDVSR